MWSRCMQQSWCSWPGVAAKRPADCIRGWQPHTLEVSLLTPAVAHPVVTHMPALVNAKQFPRATMR